MEKLAREGSVASSTVATERGGVEGGSSGGAAGAKKCNITVEKTNTAKVHFSVKRDAPLGKLMVKYRQHMGVDSNVWKFTYDGTQIKDDETPDMLNMDEDNVIDCWDDQHGGFLKV